MNIKTILASFIAVFAVIVALSSVSAVTSDGFVTVNDLVVNDASVIGSSIYGGNVDEVIPISVYFTANGDVSDVKVKVFIEGYKDDISVSSSRFHVVSGSSYVKKFSIKLPSTFDLDNLTEDLSLVVRISAKGEDSVEISRQIVLQRESYSLNILSIETPQDIVSGSSFPVDFVVENNGNERLDNVYVRVSIPQLGVENTVYVRDLKPNPESDLNDIRDTESRRVYLTLPRNIVPGTYNLEVEAYNYDISTTAVKSIAIEDVQSGIVPTATGKTIAVGSQTTFDVVLINPSDRMVVYTLTPEPAEGLIVEIEEPVVTVPRDSSRTVRVNVRATESAQEGTHVVAVDVNSESGLVKQVKFSVNVEGKSTTTGTTSANAVTVLTVILVIVFVVLLIVLIVLLTKRPEEEETEEFGETSYY